jgi:uncharacterized NAD-dependent epimerase/dehydratase family protein
MLASGLDAEFKATGQTGILIAECGIAIDAVVSDFISGAVEWLTPDNDINHWDIIEGQGSLFHPSFAGVSLGLLHGSQADAIILCHEPTRKNMRGVKTLLPTIKDCIDENIRLGKLTNPNIQCVGIALNTSNMQDSVADLKEEISRLYEVPCFDPLKDDLSDVVAKIKSI